MMRKASPLSDCTSHRKLSYSRRLRVESLEDRRMLAGTPIDIDFSSVFNIDAIHNRSGGVNDPVNDSVDGDTALVTDSLALAFSPANGNGLPDDGTFAANGFHPDVQLGYNNDDDGLNALFLPNQNDTATIYTTKGKIDSLHIFALATKGATNLEVVLEYTDLSTQTLNSSVPDWNGNVTEGQVNGDATQYYLIDGIDTFNVTGNFVSNSNNQAIFGLEFPVDSSKFLSNITLRNTVFNTKGNQISVFGATGEYLEMVVDSTEDADDGDYSTRNFTLREAINLSNAYENADTISFSLPTISTITLSSTELLISESLTINGPGSDRITIDASSADPTPDEDNADGIRIFSLFNNSETIDVAISGLTLTGGDTTSNGGAIRNSGENLTITDSTIRNNSALFGGGLYNASNPTVSITNSKISNNSALRGGGLYVSGGTASISDSTLSENSASFDGGGLYTNTATFISGSTISGNLARFDGGGIFSSTPTSFSSPTTIVNSTISDNSVISTISAGGGVYNDQGLTIIRSSTITNNSASLSGNGSGVASLGNGLVRTEISSSIIADNATSDLFVKPSFGGNSIFSLGNNLIGVDPGGIPFLASDLLNFDPRLGPLQDNGGSTQTHLPQANSPAIDAIATPTEPTDQRGVPRQQDGNNDGAAAVDIGAVERVQSLVVNNTGDVDDGLPTNGQMTLREAINLANSNTLPNLDEITFDLNKGSTITLTSTQFSISDSVNIIGLGSESLTIDASGADPTPNDNNGDGIRIFSIFNLGGISDVSISGVTLTGGDLSFSGGAVRISKSGIATLTDIIVNDNASLDSGGGIYNEGVLTLSNSTISDNVGVLDGGGVSNIGGGVFNLPGIVNISDSTISGNTTTTRGGGLFNEIGTLTITGSTISENEAVTGAGGIFNFGDSSLNFNSGTILITRSTISGNSSTFGGGGVENDDSTLTIVDSTISGNTANSRGGGVSSNITFLGIKSTTILNSTISGNTSTREGGGVYNARGQTNIQNSTITDNTALNGEGNGVASRSNLFNSTRTEFSSSIIAGNNGSDINLTSGTTNSIFSLGNNLFSQGGGGTRALWISGNGSNGHTYEVVSVPGGINWDDAKAAAEAAGGHLATITSAEENDFVFNLIDDQVYWNSPFPCCNFGPWIGGFQEPGDAEPDEFRWVTGEDFSVFNAWNSAANEPSNNGGSNDRIRFFTLTSTNRQPLWDDAVRSSTNMVSYVIEYDAVPYDPSDIIAQNPQLGPLQDNGGATLTHALSFNSPAVDAIDPTTPDQPTTDQRGIQRPQNSGLDIGAFELTYLLGDLNLDNMVDTDDVAILLSNYGTTTGALLLEGDLDNDGSIGLKDLLLMKQNQGNSIPSSPAPQAAASASLVVQVFPASEITLDETPNNGRSRKQAVDQVISNLNQSIRRAAVNRIAKRSAQQQQLRRISSSEIIQSVSSYSLMIDVDPRRALSSRSSSRRKHQPATDIAVDLILGENFKG